MWFTNSPLRAGIAAVFALVANIATADAQVSSPSLTLGDALERAATDNHLLRAAELRIGEASGQLTQAAVWLVDNPELATSGGRRTDPDGVDAFDREYEIGIEQRLEIGGQRGGRKRVAEAGLEATRARASDVGRVVALAISLAFHESLAARERVELAERTEDLAGQLHDLAQRRLDVGEGTPLELNAAAVRLAEARRLRLAAQGRHDTLLLRLRTLIGSGPDEPMMLVGTLPDSAPPVLADDIVTSALEARPDLQAAAHRVDAAAAGVSLAGARAWPDVTIGALVAREEGDDVLRAGIRVPLVLFNRNQGNRATAEAARERAVVEQEGLALTVASEARSASLAYEQARAALDVYDADVLVALEESATLVQLAAEAGELSIADVLVVQRELVDGLRGYLDARLSLATARARLLAAAALPQTTDLEEGSR
jgi:cobalt-zinc-cadmium efflux system outer membrane protein